MTPTERPPKEPPSERPPTERPPTERPPTKEPPSERPLSVRPPAGSALFRTVEGFSTARVDSSGKCRTGSGSNSKFHLDAAFIRRVMDFERYSPNLSASSSSAVSETLAPTARTKEPSQIFQPNSLTRRLLPTVNNGQEELEGSTDRTPIGRDALDAGKRRKQRRRTREVPVRQNPRLVGRLDLKKLQVPAYIFFPFKVCNNAIKSFILLNGKQSKKFAESLNTVPAHTNSQKNGFVVISTVMTR